LFGSHFVSENLIEINLGTKLCFIFTNIFTSFGVKDWYALCREINPDLSTFVINFDDIFKHYSAEFENDIVFINHDYMAYATIISGHAPKIKKRLKRKIIWTFYQIRNAQYSIN